MYIDWPYLLFHTINEYFVIVYVLAVIFVVYKLKKSKLLDAIISISLGGIASEVLKYFFNTQRPLPIREDIIFEGGGFPSTHTAVAFTAFFFLLFCVKPQYNAKNKITIISFIFAFLVLFLRIISHAHFVTDTIGGVFVGFIAMMPFVFYDISERRIK